MAALALAAVMRQSIVFGCFCIAEELSQLVSTASSVYVSYKKTQTLSC